MGRAGGEERRRLSSPHSLPSSPYHAASCALAANLGICYGLGCNLTAPGSCSPAEAAAITAYADDLRGNVTGVVAASFPGRDSYFLTSCFQHEESCRAVDWYGITINGQTPNSTFYNWYTTGVGPNARRVDGPWPSDASCAPPGYYHGSC